MDQEKVPIGSVLPGVVVDPIDDDESPEFVFLLMKLRTPDGSSWSFRTSGSPNREELLGALMVQVELVKAGLVGEWDVDP